jgi:hypothetical protein
MYTYTHTYTHTTTDRHIDLTSKVRPPLNSLDIDSFHNNHVWSLSCAWYDVLLGVALCACDQAGPHSRAVCMHCQSTRMIPSSKSGAYPSSFIWCMIPSSKSGAYPSSFIWCMIPSSKSGAYPSSFIWCCEIKFFPVCGLQATQVLPNFRDNCARGECGNANVLWCAPSAAC